MGKGFGSGRSLALTVLLLLVCVNLILEAYLVSEEVRVVPSLLSYVDQHSASTGISATPQLKLNATVQTEDGVARMGGSYHRNRVTQQNVSAVRNVAGRRERDPEFVARMHEGDRLQRDASVVQFETEWCTA